MITIKYGFVFYLISILQMGCGSVNKSIYAGWPYSFQTLQDSLVDHNFYKFSNQLTEFNKCFFENSTSQELLSRIKKEEKRLQTENKYLFEIRKVISRNPLAILELISTDQDISEIIFNICVDQAGQISYSRINGESKFQIEPNNLQLLLNTLMASYTFEIRKSAPCLECGKMKIIINAENTIKSSY